MTLVVPPLVLSRLGRGGKTTMLHLIYRSLKEQGFAPIYISFSGSFKRFPGESDARAILRLIAVQFINLPEGHYSSRYNFSFSEFQVLKYLDDISGGNRSIVLLIDELNALRVPVDGDAANLLRHEFLDKAHRYLVFTTHVPMDMGITTDQFMGISNIPPSPRGYKPLPMPICTDVVKMRSMFTDRSIVVTPAQVAFYGGIPSLLYCALALPVVTMTPSYRVAMLLTVDPIPEAEVVESIALRYFVNEVLLGLRKHAVVRLLDRFSSVDQIGKSRWPLCFQSAIIGFLSRMPVAIIKICSLIDELSVYPLRTETGLDWENIVQVAILLRCMGAYFGDNDPPFLGRSCTVHDIKCVTIPTEYQTLDDAHRFIVDCTRAVKVGTALYISPQFARFPDYDGFLLYKESDSRNRIIGLQIKLLRGYPKNLPPSWMEAAYLIRGGVPVKAFAKEMWQYLNDQEMKSLLGYSLQPLYPTSWPAVPDADDFM